MDCNSQFFLSETDNFFMSYNFSKVYIYFHTFYTSIVIFTSLI